MRNLVKYVLISIFVILMLLGTGLMIYANASLNNGFGIAGISVLAVGGLYGVVLLCFKCCANGNHGCCERPYEEL